VHKPIEHAMDENYCLYALTWADCPVNNLGPGVDPRFAVELIGFGQLAALTSRVGLDQFDLTKLQEGSADFPWLSSVAVRHNEIIEAVARHVPVLPMRLGVFFASRSSLIAKLTPQEANVAEFLRRIEDRHEWAVKIYVDENRAEKAILANTATPRSQTPIADSPPVRPYIIVDPPHANGNDASTTKSFGHIGHCAKRDAQPPDAPARAGGGTQYLAAKGRRADRLRQVEATVRHAVSTVEAQLQRMTDTWHRLRPLPATLTNRPEKMAWNGAFLLPRSNISSFQTACERLRDELAPRGLLVELTGPWPPYHFCPSFEPQRENSPCQCTY
jgi:hypothetical protein